MTLGALALAMTVGAASQAAAQTAADRTMAERWVRGVYASYDDGPDARGPELFTRVFSARLNRLIRRYGVGDAPNRGIDADPVCNCQDWQNVRVRSVRVANAGRGRLNADVRFTNMGQASRHTLVLVREGRGWRVDDVVRDGHSFASEFNPRAEWLR